MDVNTCIHSYELIIIKPYSEIRKKCTKCGSLGIIPYNAQADSTLIEEFEASLQDDASHESFISATCKILQRTYEIETGLPHFTGSQDYGDWLTKRMEKKE